MTTNEFERDFNDQAGLKRPGRIDFRTLQNTADAGDGSPGVQKCFRNYLHEGGMEKDIDLLGFGIKGTSVDISNVKLRQLSNIGSVTISGAQWEYVGGADQPVKQADSPTFGGLTVNGSVIITGTVDDVDISDFKTDYDAKINQNLKTTDSPTFVGLTLSANIVTTSTVDGVDISAHTHSGAGQGGTINHTNISNVLASQHHTKYTNNEALAQAKVGNSSNNIIHANDTERQTTDTSKIMKITTIYENINNCKISFDYKKDTESGG